MGNITVKIDDKLEDRLREYVWKKYRGKGRHLGAIIEEALTEFLDKHIAGGDEHGQKRI